MGAKKRGVGPHDTTQVKAKVLRTGRKEKRKSAQAPRGPGTKREEKRERGELDLTWDLEVLWISLLTQTHNSRGLKKEEPKRVEVLHSKRGENLLNEITQKRESQNRVTDRGGEFTEG